MWLRLSTRRVPMDACGNVTADNSAPNRANHKACRNAFSFTLGALVGGIRGSGVAQFAHDNAVPNAEMGFPVAAQQPFALKAGAQEEGDRGAIVGINVGGDAV